MKTIVCFILLFLSTQFHGQSQGVIGKWNTIDDVTGKVISVVEIFEHNNKIYGKVSEIFNPKSRNRVCENCTGEDKNKAILGLTVIKGLVKEGEEYCNGRILDPKTGKLYKCYITLEGTDKLKVRGYIGVSLFGRTQYWERLK
jgi:uncharacterized protein (DUF2147 family)